MGGLRDLLPDLYFGEVRKSVCRIAEKPEKFGPNRSGGIHSVKSRFRLGPFSSARTIKRD